jgi:predicted dehydrogenase
MPSNRREFLTKTARGAAGAAAALALPAIISPRALGAANSPSPSDRIRLGFIGVGNRGGQNLEEFLRLKDRIDVAAVCEVDSKRLAEAQQTVDKALGRKCAAYADYRKLLDDPNVDAVVVTTPDHWHALPTIDACRAGKDVYCEKPLTLSIAEGQAMVAAARAHQRIVQTGSQQRSDDNFRLACELVRSGRIGKVHTVRVGISRVNFEGPAVPDGEPPAELDYDFWLGPAPNKPYNTKHVHYNFRFFWDYSGGQMTNWGAHHLDITQWALGMDDSGPVMAVGKARYNKDHWYEVPEWSEVNYKYANGTTVICGHDQRGGATFEGDDGTIYVNRGKLESTPGDIIQEPLADSDVHLYESRDHHANWLDCIHSRKLPICDVAIGHRSASMCHLGNIAIRTQQEVRWDPAAERIVGNDEAAHMVSRPYRAPWTLPATT